MPAAASAASRRPSRSPGAASRRELLERSDFSEETGAGIQLGPNATRALARPRRARGDQRPRFKPEAISIYDGLTGRKLTSLPLGKRAEQRYGAPYLTLHRADLHAGLRAAAESLASVTLRPGFEVSAVDTQGADIAVRGIDGSEANGAALVGADGLWSAVRPLIAPAASLRFTGATAWRTLLPRADLPAPFDASEVGLWLGPRAHLVHYPVRGGADLNVVAVTEGGAALQGWNQTGSAETLLAGFTGWSKEARSLLQRAAAWRSWSLYGLTGLRRFADGRIALLGDAAHPVLPYLAQGAALAIEDAVTLAETVAASARRPGAGLSPLRGTPPAARRRRPAPFASLRPHLSFRRALAAGAQSRARTAKRRCRPRRSRLALRHAALNGYGLSFLSLFEMAFDRRQDVRGELLQRLVFPSLGIFVEQVRGLFVRLDLLLDVERVERLGLRRGQSIEHALLRVGELGRQRHGELLGLDDALQFLGRLAVRLDHMPAERLDRL